MFSSEIFLECKINVIYIFGPLIKSLMSKQYFYKILRINIETKRSIFCSTYLCTYWLILVCAVTGDQTYNLGIVRWRSAN